ncbi:MAG: penicillin-insensitive murein endopeptidase [Candidatus Aminicenantes bacterium]|nr:penicillin-insensitive murein endopeptidase [Candidatus Aminicenantes bacterium]
MLTLWLAASCWLGLARAALDRLPAAPPVPPAGTAVAAVDAPAAPSAFLLELPSEELFRRVESDAASLGSMSIGAPGGGILINPLLLTAEPGWTLIDPNGAYATSETVNFIRTAVATVHELFPATPAISIGDISTEKGGRMKRHATHQAGRDVDFGFYYKSGYSSWYVPGTAANMDLPRNWVFVRALLLRTDIETILLDIRVQRLLYAYALKIGEDKDWLDRVFQVGKGSAKALIIHVVGHRTHYHVRFYNRVAQELGRRVYPFLVQLDKIKPPVFTVPHLVRSGESLGLIAARYGSSVRAIQQTNGLSGTLIRAGRALRIPLRGVNAPPAAPVFVPARPLPSKTPEILAGVAWPTAIGLYGEALKKVAACPWLLGGTPRFY